MDGNFLSELEEALEQRREYIENTQLSRLKEEYRSMHAGFEGLYKLLLQKALINEDPYKYEEKLPDIQIPPTGPFSETDKKEEMSIRLSKYESQLDFLINYFQFNLDNLSLKQIKTLVNLTTYFNWANLRENYNQLNTKTLAEIINKVRQPSDNIATGVINNTRSQMEKSMKNCLSILKEVAHYHRERYKYEIRSRILTQIDPDYSYPTNQRKELAGKIKQQFPTAMEGRPFYPELIQEVIEEDYGPDAGTQHQNILEKLRVQSKEKKQKKQKIDYKSYLLEAARILSNAGSQMEAAIGGLLTNQELIDQRKLTFKEKFRRWLMDTFKSESETRIYDIEYLDPVSATRKSEKINFDSFIQRTRKKAKLLSSMGNRVSPTYQKLESAGEEQLYSLLESNITELSIIHRRLSGLNTYLRSEVPRSQRERMRGVKAELSAIKNTMIKANQKIHEYAAKKEEVDQLKKLGVDIE